MQQSNDEQQFEQKQIILNNNDQFGGQLLNGPINIITTNTTTTETNTTETESNDQFNENKTPDFGRLNINLIKPITTTTTTSTGTRQQLQQTDVDECLDRQSCGKEAICENLPGSFRCSCPPGFTGDPAVECTGK